MTIDMNIEKGPLIGPRAHERDPKLIPEGVRCKDGTPLYYLFLEDPNKVNLTATEVQNAKKRLSSIIAIDKEGKIFSCKDKTREEARSILLGIESSQVN